MLKRHYPNKHQRLMDFDDFEVRKTEAILLNK